MSTSLRARQLFSGGQCKAAPRHTSSRCARIAAPAASSNAAVLEHVDFGLDEVIYTPDHQDYLSDLGNLGSAVPDQLSEYQSASKQLSELEALSNELFMNLQEIGDMEPLVQQKVAEENQEAIDLRRQRRAAARASRNSPTAAGAAAAVAPPRHSQLSEPALDAQIDALTQARQRLDGLIEHAPTPSTSAPAPPPSQIPSTPQSQPVQSPPLSFMQMGPSLSLGPSISLPSSVETSVWARQKHSKRASRTSVHASSEASSSAEAAERPIKAKRSVAKSTSTKAAVLTADQEKELTRLVKDCLKLEKVKAEIVSIIKREPTTLEWSKAVGMDLNSFATRLDAGESAKKLMLQMNRRLVMGMCRRYQKLVPMADLVQVGMQGLVKGIEKFDESKGFRFSTYAHWWIRQALTRVISDQSRSIRLPSHLYAELVRIRVSFATHRKEFGVAPTTAQTAEALGLTKERVEMILDLGKETTSLDKPMGEESDGGTMMDSLQDDRPDADHEVEQEMLKREVDSILGGLTEREATIIKLRFGLDGSPEMSLENAGQQFGITRERVRQIEAKVLRKLKSRQDETMIALQDYTESKELELAARASHGTRKS
eukprot:gene17398-23699_t